MIYKVVCDYISIYGFFVNIKKFRKADEVVLCKAEESLFDKLWITFFRFMNAIFLRKKVAIKVINKYLYFSLNPKVVEVIERNAEKINVELVSGINRFLNGEEKDVAMWINTADGEKVEWTDKMRAFFKKYKFYFKISERWIPKQGNGNIPKQPEAAQKSVETQDEEIPI